MVIEAASSRFDRTVSTDATLEKIADGHIFTEGPVWSSRDKALTYVEIIGDTIWNWQVEGGNSVFFFFLRMNNFFRSWNETNTLPKVVNDEPIR